MDPFDLSVDIDFNHVDDEDDENIEVDGISDDENKSEDQDPVPPLEGGLISLVISLSGVKQRI